MPIKQSRVMFPIGNRRHPGDTITDPAAHCHSGEQTGPARAGLQKA